MIKATFFIECGLARAVKGCDGANLKFSRPMPFVPQPGNMIVVMEGDDYRKVEEIFWSEKEGLQMFLEFQDKTDLEWMKELGWVSAD